MRRGADTPIVLKRPDGSFDKANLAECHSWIATRTDWGDSGYGRGRLVTEDFEIHHGNVRPHLYRTLRGEWFRRVRLDEKTQINNPAFGQEFIGVTADDAKRLLAFWGY